VAPSSGRSGGAISGTGYLGLQSFATGGNRSYTDFWVITGDPGYKTPTVAPKHSVKEVAGAIHSTGGTIGTHLLLWVPSQDSMVTTWG
jgi:hypothetical protein